MELIHSLSDDQIALIGCVVVLFVSGSLLVLGHVVGQSRNRNAALQPLPRQTLEMNPRSFPVETASDTGSGKKAA